MSSDIYVAVEQRDGEIARVSLELIGEAKRLASELGQKAYAMLLGDNIKGKAKELIEYGADGVIFVEDPMLAEYATEPYAKAVSAVINECSPEIVLFGATSIGRDLAPRVAARVGTGLTADCTRLDLDFSNYVEYASKNTNLDTSALAPGDADAGLMQTRPAFGGNIMATILCKTRPQMASVRPGVMKMAERDAARVGEIREMNVGFSPEDMNVAIKEVVRETHKTTDIADAKCLVSGGRGIGGPEFFGKLKELAELLGGDFSSSRANVDAGWAPKDRQVGQTGKTVRPELYLACGISGAIQHVAGMEGSDFIIAINKNEDAAIFEVADLGIVGDVRAIVPKLIEAVAKYKAKAEGIMKGDTDAIQDF
ncbi:MAG: electron transfer flavoprotein subunit alpha/FixB family protein [Clostridiales bacterium]|nr:electron transfer flavoprotein subunit alpha/FixB family protein [Clostridiales bacterium]